MYFDPKIRFHSLYKAEHPKFNWSYYQVQVVYISNDWAYHLYFKVIEINSSFVLNSTGHHQQNNCLCCFKSIFDFISSFPCLRSYRKLIYPCRRLHLSVRMKSFLFLLINWFNLCYYEYFNYFRWWLHRLIFWIKFGVIICNLYDFHIICF